MRFGPSLGGLVLLSVVLAASCADPELLANLKALGEGCLLDSDCEEDLVCVFRKCHYQCVETKDCTNKPGAPADVLCVKGDKPTNVCQLEVLCNSSLQCPGDELCGVDGHCRDRCTVAAECVVPQVCVGGTCAELDQLVNGVLPGTPTDPEGQPCAYNSDCQDPLVCKNGSCAAQCKTSKDCPLGQVCSGNECLYPSQGGSGGQGGGGSGGQGGGGSAGQGGGGSGGGGSGGVGGGGQGGSLPNGYGTPCNLQSDCLQFGLVCGLGGQCVYACNLDIDCPFAGNCCVSHQCVAGPCGGGGAGGGGMGGAGGGGAGGGSGAQLGLPCVTDGFCQDQSWCNGAELCTGGACVAAANGACDSGSVCMLDTCSEPVPPAIVGVCLNTPIAGAEDADGDGFVNQACTNGNDCDDDPLTGLFANPQEPERCDGVDNDCDGLVDDHAVTPRGPVRVMPLSAGVLPLPAVVPFGLSDHLLLRVDVNSEVELTLYDSADVEIVPPTPAGFLADGGVLGAAWAVGPGHALTAARTGDGPVGWTVATKVGAAFVTSPPVYVDVSANSEAHQWHVSAAWTGAHYVFAYRILGGAHYTFVNPDGSVADFVHDVGSGPGGPVIGSSRVRAVASASGTVLVAYEGEDGMSIKADVLHPSGGNFDLAATLTLPTVGFGGMGSVWDLAASGSGFLLALPGKATYFEVSQQDQLANVLAMPGPIPAGQPVLGSDGVGFLLAYEASDADIVFWRPDLPNPPEFTSGVLQTVTSCDPFVGLGSGRMTVGCATSKRWRPIGCLP